MKLKLPRFKKQPNRPTINKDTIKKIRNSISLRKQLSRALGLLIGFLVILMLFYSILLKTLQDDYRELLNNYEKINQDIQSLKDASNDLYSNMGNLVSLDLSKGGASIKYTINEDCDTISTLVSDYVAYSATEDGAALSATTLKKITDTFQLLLPLKDQIIQAHDGKKEDMMMIAYSKYKTTHDELTQNIALLLDDCNKSMQYASKKTENKMKHSNILAWSISGIFILVALFISIHTIHKTLKKIRKLSAFATELKQGNLSTRVWIEEKDELGRLADDIGESLDVIESMVCQILTLSATMNQVVTSCSDEISQLNGSIQDTAAISEELSAQFENTAASSEVMNELSTSLHSDITIVSNKANESGTLANQMAKKLHQLAENTSKSQEILIEHVASLSEELKVALEQAKAVNEIQNLSSDILDITEQTNLLSLNASIEAARAGESGLGFKVVANEIRSLADTSKQTVQKIQNVASIVTSSVENLMKSSHELMDYLQNNVQTDYNNIVHSVQTTSAEIEQVDQVAALLKDLSGRAFASTDEMTSTIGSVAASTSEGAKATETVAQNISSITGNTDSLLHQILLVKSSSDKLNQACQRFQVSNNKESESSLNPKLT